MAIFRYIGNVVTHLGFIEVIISTQKLLVTTYLLCGVLTKCVICCFRASESSRQGHRTSKVILGNT